MKTRISLAIGAVMLITVALAACADDQDGQDGQDGAAGTGAPATSEPSTAAADEEGTTLTFQQHRYRDGESFEYFYETTEATYATEPARDGAVPRLTDLQTIDEVRTRLRISIASDGDKLVKQIELFDTEYRQLTKAELEQDGGAKERRPIQDHIPKFPERLRYEYEVGTDGAVAQRLDQVFGDAMDPLLFKLVDIFTWPSIVETIPEELTVGRGAINPAVDVTLFGGTFHNHHRVLVFDRIDLIDGDEQAYFKVQVPGNYFETFGIDTNYQLAFHVPLDGDAAGLVSSGELQELLYGGGQGGAPRTATVRQVSMTMQTERTRSAVDTVTEGQ